jgi:hypothetical protein
MAILDMRRMTMRRMFRFWMLVREFADDAAV